MRQRTAATILAIGLVGAACSSEPTPEASAPTAEASTPTSDASPRPTGDVVPIVSTGADELRDLVRPGDPAAAFCLVDLGVRQGEFYDKDVDELVFPEETHFFEARYDDGASVQIRVHPDLVGDLDAQDQVMRVAEPISLLPTELRRNIARVGFLDGESTAQADGGGEGIHVYASNVEIRENAMRFEETIFHESVHTSLDDEFARTEGWLNAQRSDGQFLTEYAADFPETEDLAETALYAWALTHHPERVSQADALAWEQAVPERISFIENILSAPGEGYAPVEPSCTP